MAKLVIGTNKQVVTPAVVRDMSPAHYIERAVDANGKLVNNVSNFIDLTGITDIGPYALCSAFRGNTNLTGTIDMSGITTISGNNACDSMFYSCSNITKIDCSGIETITGQGSFSYCFAQNTNMIEADFSGLKYITGTNAFSNTFFMCEKMTTFKCDNLESINIGTNNCATGSLFAYDRKLVSLSFPKLFVINGILGVSYAQLAADCERLESVSFGGVKASTFANQTNQLQYLFNNRTGVSAPNGCTVHFPSNFDPSDPNHTFDASTLTGYPTFNGNASYIHVAFDLPATE